MKIENKNQLTNLITIVIPSHNRHHLLERALKYYANFGAKILVADSTASCFPNIKNYNCHYFHLPEMKLYEKILHLINEITTPYMIFCADDDFTLKNSILLCLDFLEKNPEYVCAQGKTLFFKNTESKPLISIGMYSYWWIWDLEDFNQPDPYTRICKSFKDTLACMYAVSRTDEVKAMCRLFNTYKLKGTLFFEFTLYFHRYLSGFIKVLPILYQIRSTELQEDYRENIVLHDNLNSPDCVIFKKLITDQLLAYYDKKTLLEKGGVEHIITIISNWGHLECVYNKNIKTINVKRNIHFKENMFNKMANFFYLCEEKINRLIEEKDPNTKDNASRDNTLSVISLLIRLVLKMTQYVKNLFISFAIKSKKTSIEYKSIPINSTQKLGFSLNRVARKQWKELKGIIKIYS